MANLPENLQSSEKYQTMEENVEALDEVLDRIGEAKDGLESVL